MSQRSKAQRFGYELIRLIEDAQTVSRQNERLARMRAWFDANPDHPKRSQREARYWHVASVRNEAQAALNDRTVSLIRLHRDLTTEALEAMSEAYGAPVTASMATQIAAIAKEHGESGIWQIVDTWAMEQTARQERMGL